MFSIIDSHPGINLSDIEPIEARIECLVARRLHICKNLDENVSITGSLRIVEGLSYHHNRYQHLCEELGSYLKRHRDYTTSLRSVTCMDDLPTPEIANEDESKLLGFMHHETVAYFNRIGQFYYFARRQNSVALLPRMSELMLFRNKHSAHRSIDTPGKETEEERRLQSISVGLTSTLSNGVPIVTLNHGSEFLQFNFDEDHSTILDEVFQAYNAILCP